MGGEEENSRDPIFKDIRRYYCEYCGICRSKKTLIAAHIRDLHKDELKEKELNEGKGHDKKLNICEECGASFQKPAHLKQHMQSHSIERPFVCSVDDCQSSYRRKDHLSRHMLQHQGKLFECSVEGCKRTFAFQGNMTKHVKEFHDESASADVEHPKEYVCLERGCGKVFNYPSKLHKHEESHVTLDSVEALCAEPGCMKYFSNERCLREHIRSCHQYIICDKCGTTQLKKNIKRHMRMHEAGIPSERIKCSFEGCSLDFSTAGEKGAKDELDKVQAELAVAKSDLIAVQTAATNAKAEAEDAIAEVARLKIEHKDKLAVNEDEREKDGDFVQTGSYGEIIHFLKGKQMVEAAKSVLGELKEFIAANGVDENRNYQLKDLASSGFDMSWFPR